MGFSKDNQVKLEYVPIVGPVEVSLLACCPTLEEAQELGIPMNKETNYFGFDEERNCSTARLDFYVKAEFVERNGALMQNILPAKDDKVFSQVFKIPVFLSDEICTTSGKGKLPEGTIQFIDKHGKSAFIESGKPTPEWIDDESKVPAVRGEASLYEFLIAATHQNTGKTAPSIRLETTMQDIINGDVSELQAIVAMFNEETFFILAGVNDDGYSEVFRGAFARTKMGVKSLITKAEDKGYPWKCEFAKTLQYYNPSAPIQKSKPEVDVDYV